MILGIALSITLYNVIVLEPSAVVALEEEMVGVGITCVFSTASLAAKYLGSRSDLLYTDVIQSALACHTLSPDPG